MIRAVIFDYYGVIYLDTSGGHALNEPLTAAIRTIKGCKIATLSNIERSTLDKLLERHELTKVFDVVLASSETDYTKPQLQIFQIMLDLLGVQADEAAFIDDLKDNVEAAASLGMKAHLFTDNQGLFNFLDFLAIAHSESQ